MSPSTLSGQDVTGINDNSKNTTLVTYIADAWNWGAEIFCECEVRYIEKDKDGKGYRVYFAWYGRNRGCFKANVHGDLMWVHAKNAVFLGAGAIATTEILLRSKAMGLQMSDMVGQNMSGNGDILAFGYNTDEIANGVGREHPDPYNPVGPCITSVIDCREGNENPLDGYVIEEGVIPEALTPFFQAMLEILPGSEEPNETLLQKTQAKLAQYGSWIMGPYFKKGAVARTQTYLVMSHDSRFSHISGATCSAGTYTNFHQATKQCSPFRTTSPSWSSWVLRAVTMSRRYLRLSRRRLRQSVARWCIARSTLFCSNRSQSILSGMLSPRALRFSSLCFVQPTSL
jgi:hypothetical protein